MLLFLAEKLQAIRIGTVPISSLTRRGHFWRTSERHSFLLSSYKNYLRNSVYYGTKTCQSLNLASPLGKSPVFNLSWDYQKLNSFLIILMAVFKTCRKQFK